MTTTARRKDRHLGKDDPRYDRRRDTPDDHPDEVSFRNPKIGNAPTLSGGKHSGADGDEHTSAARDPTIESRAATATTVGPAAEVPLVES